MAAALVTEMRRIPRIEGLDHPIQFRLNGTVARDATIRDIAVNSMRVEFRGKAPFVRHERVEMQAQIPGLGLYLTCRGQVARSYTPSRGRRGVALRLVDLDPAARGAIRAMYPPDVSWPEATA